jgi:hypothetical protein
MDRLARGSDLSCWGLDWCLIMDLDGSRKGLALPAARRYSLPALWWGGLFLPTLKGSVVGLLGSTVGKTVRGHLRDISNLTIA